MFKLNKRNIIAFVIALLIAVGFLWSVLTPPSFYNILPYQIYESIHPGGNSEAEFIRIFDICSVLIAFIITYILARNALKIYGLFE